MKRFSLLSIASFAELALAHPGHGKPGFAHAHTLADLALILYAIFVVALAGWALLRVLRKKTR